MAPQKTTQRAKEIKNSKRQLRRWLTKKQIIKIEKLYTKAKVRARETGPMRKADKELYALMIVVAPIGAALASTLIASSLEMSVMGKIATSAAVMMATSLLGWGFVKDMHSGYIKETWAQDALRAFNEKSLYRSDPLLCSTVAAVVLTDKEAQETAKALIRDTNFEGSLEELLYCAKNL